MTVIAPDTDAALAGVADGATVLVGGFGTAGQPVELIDALIRTGARELTVVSNNAGNGDHGLAALLAAGQVRRMICSFPRQADSYVFDELYRAGKIELEVVPQGNLAERIRAAGAGIGAFFSPTGVGTPLAEGKELRTIDGRDYVLEHPIRGDLALVKAHVADTRGNLVYRKTARNFGPVMATAATTTVVQVDRIVEAGQIDPEVVVTPGHLRRPRGGLPRRAPRSPRKDRPDDARASRTRPAEPDELARQIAADIPAGSYVNLGIGQPTTVADHLPPERDVVLHTENGMLGMGPAAHGDDVDPDLVNAGKIPVTETPGAAYFHHADSFAMMRGGHLDVCVLGAFQVSGHRRPGQLAHRRTGCDPGRRRRDGPRHRREERLRDDDALRQARSRRSWCRRAPIRSPASAASAGSTPMSPPSTSPPDGVVVTATFGTTVDELRSRLDLPLLAD